MQLTDDQITKLNALRDRFVSLSARVYVGFYIGFIISTLLTAGAQLLIYEEENYPEIANKLDLIAMILNTLSVVIMQVLAISEVKSIAGSLDKIGKLINIYLSPFVKEDDREAIEQQILTISKDIQTFWVKLPTVDFDSVGGNAIVQRVQRIRGMLDTPPRHQSVATVL
jgi:hypothetical protein